MSLRDMGEDDPLQQNYLPAQQDQVHLHRGILRPYGLAFVSQQLDPGAREYLRRFRCYGGRARDEDPLRPLASASRAVTPP